MSEVKFTPGEWRVRERVTNGVQGYEICWSDDDECVTDHVYEREDAYLMAASKKLYGALEELVEQLEGEYFNLKAARDALAKARIDGGEV